MEIEKYYPEFGMRIELTVRDGEFFSLVGPSGCGKTTLLRLIAGLDRPDQGRILLDGNDITGLPPAKRRIGLVFQDYALFPHLTVYGNIEYGLKVAGLPPADRKERVRELLSLFALENLAAREIHQLSGGERQRVALARALAPRPLLLLLDEPFSALDYNLRRRLRGELRELQKRLGFTVIFVTHQQEEALSLSERLGVMESGRIIQVGTSYEVYENPVSPFVARFLGDANLLPCRAEKNRDGILVCLETGETFSLPLFDNIPPGRCLLMIRPEDIDLQPPGPSPLPLISGVIRSFEYLGFINRVEIKTGNCEVKALVSKEVRDLAEGVRVSFTFDPRKVRLLPEK